MIKELIGGKFTITNSGAFGSLMSTLIINLSRSAILGMQESKIGRWQLMVRSKS